MKVLVVADSAYGNTWELARAIADAFGNNARALRPGQVTSNDIEGVELLLVGSPTQGGKPLPAVMNWLRALPPEALNRVGVAAFDTRVAAAELGFPLRVLVNVIGYAAPKLAKQLTAHGGRQAAPPEGFLVEGKEGPMKAGELERAAAWARNLVPSQAG